MAALPTGFDWATHGQAYAQPVTATPYICTWDTAVSGDITIATATTAPLQLPKELTDNASYMCFGLAATTDNKTFTFELILAEIDLEFTDTQGDPNIIRSIPISPTALTGARTTHADGGPGKYFLTDVVTDVRGPGTHNAQYGYERRWFLDCTAFDTDAVFLMSFGCQYG